MPVRYIAPHGEGAVVSERRSRHGDGYAASTSRHAARGRSLNVASLSFTETYFASSAVPACKQGVLNKKIRGTPLKDSPVVFIFF